MKKKPLIRTLLIAVPAILLLCIAGVIWFSFESPQPLKNPVLTSDDFRNQFQLMQQLMRLFAKKEIPEEYVLKLTPIQLNSLIKTGSLFRTKRFALQTYHLTVSADGKVGFHYGHDTKMRWLHGGVIPLSGMVKVAKNGDELDVAFRSLQAGLIPLPEIVGKRAFDSFLSRYGNTPEFRLVMECVKSLTFDSKEKYFILTLRTKLLRRLL